MARPAPAAVDAPDTALLGARDLDVAVPDSNDGVWPAELVTLFDTRSPGTDGITVWKGFQRNFSTNLELLHREPLH